MSQIPASLIPNRAAIRVGHGVERGSYGHGPSRQHCGRRHHDDPPIAHRRSPCGEVFEPSYSVRGGIGILRAETPDNY